MNSAANISPRSPRNAVVTLVAAAPPEMLDRFMRIEEVSEITGLSKATIYRYVNAGTMPAPIPLGSRRVGFLLSEVQAYMNERLAKRTTTTTKEPA